MISAGITILMSLSTLAKQLESRKLRAAVGDVSRQIESGSSLSQAFASQSAIFHRIFVNMIKAGEASGHLDTVLMRYAAFFESQEDLKEKIKGALFYPIMLFSFGLAVVLFIVTFVIPQFAEIYMKAGIRLPIPTLIVYNMGLAIKSGWYIIIAILAALIIGINYYAKTEGGAFLFDRMKLVVPVTGPLYRRVAISRFARTLSTLLGSGVPILESLDITREVVGNRVLAGAIGNIRGYVEKGEKMSKPMKVSGEFPADVVQMVSVGEETGDIDQMLNKIADFYDMMVNYAVKKLTTIIEPVFLAIMGLMVGTIMASMLMPIFDMVKTLRH
jgi:type IV pilus assembly protein PilC